jgi:putative glutamine amidotransferase
MLVILSRSSLPDKYALWLKRLYPGIELADAYSADRRTLDEALRQCSGILLPGGADVDPAHYGKAAEASRCEGIDGKLDRVELDLVETALEKKLPLLAICRGIQLINIFFKGTLIIDIPSDYGNKVEHRNKADVFHKITVSEDSALSGYGQSLNFIVNSSHHQSIKKPGIGLNPVAWSEDGLIEAVELDQRFSHSFFAGIQWHPERMESGHLLSESIGRAFLYNAEQHRTTSL